MKVSEIITRVRDTAGDTNVLQFTDATLVNWINDGVRECAVDNNLLQKRASQTVASGAASAVLPADILKIHSIKANGQKLKIMTLDEFDRETDGATASGTPQIAYLWAGALNLYPTPSEAVQVTIDYIYNPADLTSSGGSFGDQVPVLPVGYHQRLVDYCLAQVAQQDDDLNRYAVKMEEFRTGVAKLNDTDRTEEDSYSMIGISTRDAGEEYWYD